MARGRASWARVWTAASTCACAASGRFLQCERELLRVPAQTDRAAQRWEHQVDTIALSVDPYMRCRLDPAHPQLGEYIEPIALNAVIDGGGVGRVTESRHPRFSPGQVIVVPFTGYPWQDKDVVLNPEDESLALQLCPDYLLERPSLLLGALGMPGMTSWFCMLHAGRPKRSDTVVISGAAGACGSLAGQLAKVHSKAKRVVGICGSDEKGSWLVEDMGFDFALTIKVLLSSLN